MPFCVVFQGDYSFSGLGEKTHSTEFSSGKSDSKCYNNILYLSIFVLISCLIFCIFVSQSLLVQYQKWTAEHWWVGFGSPKATSHPIIILLKSICFISECRGTPCINYIYWRPGCFEISFIFTASAPFSAQHEPLKFLGTSKDLPIPFTGYYQLSSASWCRPL